MSRMERPPPRTSAVRTSSPPQLGFKDRSNPCAAAAERYARTLQTLRATSPPPGSETGGTKPYSIGASFRSNPRSNPRSSFFPSPTRADRLAGDVSTPAPQSKATEEACERLSIKVEKGAESVLLLPGAGTAEEALVTQLRELATIVAYPSADLGVAAATIGNILSMAAADRAGKLGPSRLAILKIALDIVETCLNLREECAQLTSLKSQILDFMREYPHEGRGEDVGLVEADYIFALAVCCHAAALQRGTCLSDATNSLVPTAATAAEKYASFITNEPWSNKFLPGPMGDAFRLTMIQLGKDLPELKAIAFQIKKPEESMDGNGNVIIGGLYCVRDAQGRDAGVRLQLEAPHFAATDGNEERDTGNEVRMYDFRMRRKERPSNL